MPPPTKLDAEVHIVDLDRDSQVDFFVLQMIVVSLDQKKQTSNEKAAGESLEKRVGNVLISGPVGSLS